MQDYRTVNCYNKGRLEEDAGVNTLIWQLWNAPYLVWREYGAVISAI